MGRGIYISAYFSVFCPFVPSIQRFYAANKFQWFVLQIRFVFTAMTMKLTEYLFAALTYAPPFSRPDHMKEMNQPGIVFRLSSFNYYKGPDLPGQFAPCWFRWFTGSAFVFVSWHRGSLWFGIIVIASECLQKASRPGFTPKGTIWAGSKNHLV